MNAPRFVIADRGLAIHYSRRENQGVQHLQPPSLEGSVEPRGIPRRREGTGSLPFSPLVIFLQELVEGGVPYPHLSRHSQLANSFGNAFAHALDGFLEFRRCRKNGQQFLFAPTRMPVTH